MYLVEQLEGNVSYRDLRGVVDPEGRRPGHCGGDGIGLGHVRADHRGRCASRRRASKPIRRSSPGPMPHAAIRAASAGALGCLLRSRTPGGAHLGRCLRERLGCRPRRCASRLADLPGRLYRRLDGSGRLA